MRNKKVSKLFNHHGNLLISDQYNNRVIETTPRGEIVWSYGHGPYDFTEHSPLGVHDAQRMGELTLISATGIPPGAISEAPSGVVDSRVLLVDKKGKIVWQYGSFGMSGMADNQLYMPVYATFVPFKGSHSQFHAFHGTILITDQGNNRIIQVDAGKKIVWQYPNPNEVISPDDQLDHPNSAQKLDNGHVLIADGNHNRVLEVNRQHKILHIFTASGTLSTCTFASRLPNGNTLLTDAGNNRLVEVNEDDEIIWQYSLSGDCCGIPSRGVRLENEDTLIADPANHRIIRLNLGNSINANYGLPVCGCGGNSGFDINTIQLGLYAPYDAKVIGDHTGGT